MPYVMLDRKDIESTALSPMRGRGLTFVERRRISLRRPFGNRIFALSREAERVPHFLLDTGGCIKARLQPGFSRADRRRTKKRLLAAAAGCQGLNRLRKKCCGAQEGRGFNQVLTWF
jgi:hypothetical protein